MEFMFPFLQNLSEFVQLELQLMTNSVFGCYSSITVSMCSAKFLIAIIHIIDPSLTWVMMTTSAMVSTATEKKEKVVFLFSFCWSVVVNQV